MVLYTWGLGLMGQLGHGSNEKLRGTHRSNVGHSQSPPHPLTPPLSPSPPSPPPPPSSSADPQVVDEAAFGHTQLPSVAGGQWHSLAVAADGAAWAWGCGDHGRLGHGGLSNLTKPRSVHLPSAPSGEAVTIAKVCGEGGRVDRLALIARARFFRMGNGEF